MRDLQATMLGAVLGGEGLEGVAELAALETGGPVAIVLPARGLSASSSGAVPEELARYVARRLEGGGGGLPQGVEEAVPVEAGADEIGAEIAVARLEAATGPILADRGLPSVRIRTKVIDPALVVGPEGSRTASTRAPQPAALAG